MARLAVAYCFTINNPTEGEKNLIKMLNLDKEESEEKAIIRYLKYALETGEEETPHIQGYVHLFKQEQFSWIQKRLPRAAIYPTAGSIQQNVDYIGNPDFVHSENAKDGKAGKRKGGTSEKPTEYGSLEGLRMGSRPNKQNANESLLAVKDAIDQGISEKDLWDKYFPIMLRYGTKIKEYMLIKGMSNHFDAVREAQEELRIERKRAYDADKEISEAIGDWTYVIAGIEAEPEDFSKWQLDTTDPSDHCRANNDVGTWEKIIVRD